MQCRQCCWPERGVCYTHSCLSQLIGRSKTKSFFSTKPNAHVVEGHASGGGIPQGESTLSMSCLLLLPVAHTTHHSHAMPCLFIIQMLSTWVSSTGAYPPPWSTQTENSLQPPYGYSRALHIEREPTHSDGWREEEAWKHAMPEYTQHHTDRETENTWLSAKELCLFVVSCCERESRHTFRESTRERIRMREVLRTSHMYTHTIKMKMKRQPKVSMKVREYLSEI